MTWWSAPCLCLIIFLSLTKPSEENCKDYFTQKEWENNTIFKMVSLVITENKTNVAECTLESYCLQNEMCHVFHDCFDRHVKSPSEKCKPVQIVPVHTHHLMCLLARVVDSQKTVHGCEYGESSVCPLFEESWQAATALPPTDPKMTSTVVSSRAEALPTSHASLPNVTPVAKNGHHAENTAACQGNAKFYEMPIHLNENDLSLKVPLVISSTLAIVMPLAVYFYMRHQMKQDERGPGNRSTRRKPTPAQGEHANSTQEV
ncbi:uncharacterized protein LOC109506914 isoform X2 [Hippocampus comes]|uniref:uncharacterized protein LOC109506914 isoform X2 n=1 Tax=Hippocampus comes TaxID=109280 RepID=UPI00094E6BB8|nr:PREDICTED: uncharacterized protein LOC109506914 isoform X2 [Hippocampus comes]